MKRTGIDKAMEAGAAAGQLWAKAARNQQRLERLRGWVTRRRVIDDVERFMIYACFLTDRFMVEGPEPDCDQQYCVPWYKSHRLAEGYWGRLKGWPRRGTERQARFVEGFVRGAAAREVAAVSEDLAFQWSKR